ncbi:MAG TPA: ABC transporter permease, partial [Gemmatimonadaceae bacterium]|nr:ABC transporter permease [Gemmatimonadaceae bacterium]
MPWLRRLVNLARTERLARDIDREMSFHIDARADELRRAGMSEQDAVRESRRQFGNRTALRERTRDADVVAWLDPVLGDLRYALRGMRRSPGFAAVAIGSLALGIGTTSAMLSVAKGALLSSVPFPDPDRLVHVWERVETSRTPVDRAARGGASFGELSDWRAGSRAFVSLDGYDETNLTLTGLGDPARVEAARVTTGFLETLGVRAAMGRGFTGGDGRAGATPVAIVSSGFWRRQLGGDPHAIGRSLVLDGRAVTVVGVLPGGFLFAPAGGVEMLLPIDEAAARSSRRSDRSLRVVGRLRDDVTNGRASAELAAITRRGAMEAGEPDSERSAYVVPLREEIVGPVRPLLFALGAAVALMLLVACTNVASLFLARAIGRGREFAVRAALGAGRTRIVRQLLAESLLIAIVGGVSGAALAYLGVRWLATMPLHVADRLPFLRVLALDSGVLGMTMAVAMLAGAAFGVAPALHASRVSLALLGRRDGSDASGGSPGGAWRWLIIAQIAFTAILLVGAGLMARSLSALLDVDLGVAT